MSGIITVFANPATHQRKATGPYHVGGKCQVRIGAVCPIVTHEVLCGKDPPVGVIVGGLPQHPLGNILTAFTASFRKLAHVFHLKKLHITYFAINTLRSQVIYFLQVL
jgi:hypothetical protein